MKLERIPFKNLQEPSISEEILEAFQDNIDNAINTKPVLKVRTNRQQINISSNWGKAVLHLNQIEINNDNENEYFTVSDNKIVVGKDVSFVRVVAFTTGIQANKNSLGDKEFILNKNGTRTESFYQRATQPGWNGAIVISDFSVSEGDNFNIVITSQEADTLEILDGFLQIEAIK